MGQKLFPSRSLLVDSDTVLRINSDLTWLNMYVLSEDRESNLTMQINRRKLAFDFKLKWHAEESWHATIGVCLSDSQSWLEQLVECDFYRISQSQRLYKLDPISRNQIVNTCVTKLSLAQDFALIECQEEFTRNGKTSLILYHLDQALKMYNP